MAPGALFTLLYLLFFISTFIMRRMIRAKTLGMNRKKGRVVAGWTTRYILCAYLAILFGSLLEYFLARREIHPLVSAAGVLLYAAGILGRQWSFKALGEYWSVDIEVREDQKIVRKGPYRFLRHPNNIFHLLEVLGITLVPNAWCSLAVFVGTYLPVIVLRSFIEERAMQETLGEAYAAYRKETLGLVPFPLLRGGMKGGTGHV